MGSLTVNQTINTYRREKSPGFIGELKKLALQLRDKAKPFKSSVKKTNDDLIKKLATSICSHPELQAENNYSKLFEYLNGLVARFQERDGAFLLDTIVPRLGVNFYTWLDAIIKPDNLKNLKLKDQAKASPVNIANNLADVKMGDLFESRVAAALSCIIDEGTEINLSKAKYKVDDFICCTPFIGGKFYQRAKSSPLNFHDSIGIDFFVILKDQKGNKRFMPLQIKSSEGEVEKYRTELRSVSLRTDEIELLEELTDNFGIPDDPSVPWIDVKERKEARYNINLHECFPCLSVKELSFTELKKELIQNIQDGLNDQLAPKMKPDLETLIEGNKHVHILAAMINSGCFQVAPLFD